MPTTRASIVAARYLLCLAVLCVGSAFCVGYGLLLARLFDAFDTPTEIVEIAYGALAVLPLLVVLVSLFYPLYFRYGLGKALMEPR